MTRPSPKKCHAYVENHTGAFNIRAARVGKAPLVQVWVHEVGAGGRGIIMDYDEAVEFVEGLNDLLDEIEGESSE